MVPGDRRYRLGPLLGRGASAEVYRARRGDLGIDVAVKVLRAGVSGESLARLRDEARILAQLDHPGIVRLVDLVSLEGRPALVTDLVDGLDAHAIAPLPPRAALDVVAGVADALERAHQRGLVHRDVKPTNIRVGRFGQVRLLDFGIAWARDREARTASDVIVGSAPYLAPERLDEGVPGPACDVFALGCLLFELVTGRSLFEVRSYALHAARLSGQAWVDSHVEKACAPLSIPIRALTMSTLAFAPNDRPTAGRVAVLAEAMNGSGATLRAWARTFAWPEATVTGPLSGQLLTATPLLDLTPSMEPTVEDPTQVATHLRLARPVHAARLEADDSDD